MAEPTTCGMENGGSSAQGCMPASVPQSMPVMPNSGGINWSGSPDDVEPQPPYYGKTEDGAGLRILIACAMMEDEVRAAWDKYGRGMRIMWVDRGYHENPDTLRARLQQMIDDAEELGATEIILAIGLCGCGVVGLVAQRAKLVIPRFDDCVNLMLFEGKRTCRGLAQAGILYLTRGWAHDATLITGQRDAYAKKYGERKADRLMKAMWGAYRAVSLIDNGCYEVDEVREYAQKCADILEVGVQVDPGSNDIMDKLVSGNWDTDILVSAPGRVITQEDFDDYEIEP